MRGNNSGDDNWTSVAIRRSRMNGLRLIALERNRSVGNVLDMILEKANVPDVPELPHDRLRVKEVEVSTK